jgi:hypothetical protein
LAKYPAKDQRVNPENQAILVRRLWVTIYTPSQVDNIRPKKFTKSAKE